MITRDPLKVPCLTEGYWVTFPDLPGRHLAHTLSLVREPPAEPGICHASARCRETSSSAPKTTTCAGALPSHMIHSASD